MCFKFYVKIICSISRNGTTVDSLRYLTVSQALEDIASFIMFIKKLYKLEKNKVFVFGASYGGTLAALFRRKYPHMVSGGVALSAPMFREYLDKGLKKSFALQIKMTYFFIKYLPLSHTIYFPPRIPSWHWKEVEIYR